MMFEDLWGPLSSMLRVLHTGGVNQEHFDLHHQRCKSRCNLHLDLHQQRRESRCNLHLNLHKSDARECFNQNLRGLHWGFWGGKTHPFEGVGCHRFEVVGKHRVEGVDFGSPNCPESIFTPGQFFGSFDAWGSRTEPLFLRIALWGPKIANRRFKAILANRSHMLKIGVFLRIDSRESIRANRPDSRCESPGHLSRRFTALEGAGIREKLKGNN